MAKIMLVEDDNNLREIYEARLLAEGHEIISAQDGEEALALAVREKPELIISDVMMPKISGFDMLDILRSSPETKNTKVIMMTALSQLEDKDRADRLGADRYLVKSQVTLEDVIRVAREVLDGTTSSEANSIEPVAPIGGGNLDMTQPEPTPASETPMPQSSSPAAQSESTPSIPLATPPPTEPATNEVGATNSALATDNASNIPEPSLPVQPSPQEVSATELAPELIPKPEETPALTPQPQAEKPTPESNVAAIDAAQPADEELSKVEQQIDEFINGNNSTDQVQVNEVEPQDISPESITAPVATTPTIPDGFINDEAAPTAPEVDTATTTVDSDTAPLIMPDSPQVESVTTTEADLTVTPTASEAPVTEPASIAEPSLEQQPSASTGSSNTIQPIGDPHSAPDLNALAAQEAEKEAAQQVLDNITSGSEIPTAPAQESPTDSEQGPDDPSAIAL